MFFNCNYNELGVYWSNILLEKKGWLLFVKFKFGVIKKKRLILIRVCLKINECKNWLFVKDNFVFIKCDFWFNFL